MKWSLQVMLKETKPPPVLRLVPSLCGADTSSWQTARCYWGAVPGNTLNCSFRNLNLNFSAVLCFSWCSLLLLHYSKMCSIMEGSRLLLMSSCRFLDKMCPALAPKHQALSPALAAPCCSSSRPCCPLPGLALLLRHSQLGLTWVTMPWPCLLLTHPVAVLKWALKDICSCNPAFTTSITLASNQADTELPKPRGWELHVTQQHVSFCWSQPLELPCLLP